MNAAEQQFLFDAFGNRLSSGRNLKISQGIFLLGKEVSAEVPDRATPREAKHGKEQKKGMPPREQI
ncbi:hypothetical protein RUM43_010684, partial [Polyplax serrata]